MQPDWSPDSWQSKPAAQQPSYRDPAALSDALARLAKLPPLVTSWEVEALKQQLAEVAAGERFLLQGGDCSESFDECESSVIAGKLKILLQMSLVLAHGSKKRVTRIGRFAGQYAKPRSADQESRGGVSLPCYRGDLVNRLEFTAEAREPDPDLLLRGYERSALTLNFIRSLVDGGFLDLHHPEYWDLDFVSHSSNALEYQKMVESLGDGLSFLEAISGSNVSDFSRVDFYCSHEGLHLPYEQAQTRRVPRRSGWYDLATHFPWIGDRTRDPDGAHVEFFRGIENPIGVKVGPTTTPEALLGLVEILNPDDVPGRLTLIHRFGSDSIQRALPPLIDAIGSAGRTVVWCCDPMHGNTEVVDGSYKTRSFQRILSELEQAFDIHRSKGTYLGGIHFELTGDDVTECIGGARGLKAEDLGRAYKTQVDPRLNYEQALEMALLVAQRMALK